MFEGVFEYYLIGMNVIGLAFIGGSIGALLAMYLLRHKTRKDYFTVGVPLIMIMQVVVCSKDWLAVVLGDAICGNDVSNYNEQSITTCDEKK